MNTLISWLARIGDKSGALGAIVSTMGCAMCFPALASIGAALGLGFLSQWEGLFVNTLLPLFAWIALGANALGWLSHRQWAQQPGRHGWSGDRAAQSLSLVPVRLEHLDPVRRTGADAGRRHLGPGVAGAPPLRTGQL